MKRVARRIGVNGRLVGELIEQDVALSADNVINVDKRLGETGAGCDIAVGKCDCAAAGDRDRATVLFESPE